MWDPLRKKDVAATPEEQVRQWFIGELLNAFKVPQHLMMSEVGLRCGGKQYRADILVYDRNGGNLAVVECTRPEVDLTGKVLEQAMRYNMVLDVRFLFVTNGMKTFLFRREGDSFQPMEKVPLFDDMCV